MGILVVTVISLILGRVIYNHGLEKGQASYYAELEDNAKADVQEETVVESVVQAMIKIEQEEGLYFSPREQRQ